MSRSARHPLRRVLVLVLPLTVAVAFVASGLAADEPVKVPAPTVDETSASASTETAVLAGGCFWGVQGVFQHVEGVTKVVSGYAGGEQATADYELVSSGTTGHAELVSITFDPRKISYGHLLQIYFSVAHDPTQLNRQGPDHGTQYRSAIFPVSDEQERVAKAYIVELDQAKTFASPIVTQIDPGRAFYPAEEYHQDFLTRHPTHPYIVVNDLPKVEALQQLFPDQYRTEPVLVTAAMPAN